MIGERCAERPGSGMLLWQHEYYFVIEKYNGGPPRPYIYQAVEFRKGLELPEIEKENMSRKQLRATWVLEVAYAPALDVRKQSRRKAICFTVMPAIQTPGQDFSGNAQRLYEWIIARHGGQCHLFWQMFRELCIRMMCTVVKCMWLVEIGISYVGCLVVKP